MAKCSCGAEIVFARSPTGARIPLQKVDGHVYYIESPMFEDLLPYAAKVGRFVNAVDEHVYVSHFLTCADRARYSGRGRDKAKK